VPGTVHIFAFHGGTSTWLEPYGGLREHRMRPDLRVGTPEYTLLETPGSELHQNFGLFIGTSQLLLIGADNNTD
jgi:hypothetical protein